MSDLRITQMPPNALLTGAELIELVQSGVNVRAPLSQLAGATSQFTLLGNPNGSINGNLNNHFIWLSGGPQLPGGGGTSGASNAVTAGTAVSWPHIAAFGSQAPNSSAALLGGSVPLGTYPTGSVINTPNGVYMPTTFATVTSPSQAGHIRVASNGLPIAGFTVTHYFVLLVNQPGQVMFHGYCSSAGPLAAISTPSTALLNSIGLGMDTSDTTLQFMINNAAGAASKTDLGVTPASLVGHLLRLTITCDGLGNCQLQLLDMEVGGLAYTLTLPTATTKLPAANTLLIYHSYNNNPGGAANVSFGTMWIFCTCGFGGA